MDAIQLAFPEPSNPFFSPAFIVYSRAQAIADGALVDVTEIGAEVGFKLPVAITEALHNRLMPKKADDAIGQEYDGRLWDVLWQAAFTIKLADPGTGTFSFTFALQEVDAKSGRPQTTDLRLRAVCSPGDEGEQIVTIGFPEDF